MISRVFYALPLPGVRSGRSALHGCRAGLWISLFAYHLERERFNAKAREWSGSRQNVWQQCEPCEICLGGTHL